MNFENGQPADEVAAMPPTVTTASPTSTRRWVSMPSRQDASTTAKPTSSTSTVQSPFLQSDLMDQAAAVATCGTKTVAKDPSARTNTKLRNIISLPSFVMDESCCPRIGDATRGVRVPDHLLFGGEGGNDDRRGAPRRSHARCARSAQAIEPACAAVSASRSPLVRASKDANCRFRSHRMRLKAVGDHLAVGGPWPRRRA